MIVSKMMGGLGNQMFQYSIGRALALRSGQDYFLDASFYSKHSHRTFLLDGYNIQGNPLPQANSDIFRNYQSRWYIPGYIDKMRTRERRIYRLEEPKDYYKFDERYVRTTGNHGVYLDGYWQNEKYFRDIRELLLKEFELKNNLAVSQPELCNQISSVNSVSVHIRRSDYINRFYGVLPLAYYSNCISDLKSRLSTELKVFVFGDDPEWIESSFDIGLPYVSVSGEFNLDVRQELEAMSLSRHNIIANSSFSWWAAWLNKHPGKIVYAPKVWLVNEPDKYDTSDVVPNNWIRMAW